MKNKAILLTSIIICTLIVIISFILMKAHINIDMEADIKNLDNDIITNLELSTEPKENYKVFHFELKIKHDNKITQRHVVIPDFRELIDSSGEKIYWFGTYSIQDDPKQNFAKYTYDITLNVGQLSEEDIRKIFNSQDFTISWHNEKDKFIEQRYKLGDLIKFK